MWAKTPGVIYLSAIGWFDKYPDWVFHMVTKQTQPEANDSGMVTRCFYERKQLAGNDCCFSHKAMCPPTWWANSHHVSVEVAYLISLPVPFLGCVFPMWFLQRKDIYLKHSCRTRVDRIEFYQAGENLIKPPHSVCNGGDTISVV